MDPNAQRSLSDAQRDGEKALSKGGDAISKLASDAKNFVAEFAGNPADSFKSSVAEQKTAGAGAIGDVARAAKGAADNFQDRTPELANAVRKVADRVEGVSNDVRDRSVNELVSSKGRLRRREAVGLLRVWYSRGAGDFATSQHVEPVMGRRDLGRFRPQRIRKSGRKASAAGCGAAVDRNQTEPNRGSDGVGVTVGGIGVCVSRAHHSALRDCAAPRSARIEPAPCRSPGGRGTFCCGRPHGLSWVAAGEKLESHAAGPKPASKLSERVFTTSQNQAVEGVEAEAAHLRAQLVTTGADICTFRQRELPRPLNVLPEGMKKEANHDNL
jgi:hypothetical protein